MVANGGGWCSHFIADGSTQGLAKLDASVPAGKESTALGVLGMPGYDYSVLNFCDQELILVISMQQSHCIFWFS